MITTFSSSSVTNTRPSVALTSFAISPTTGQAAAGSIRDIALSRALDHRRAGAQIDKASLFAFHADDTAADGGIFF